MKTIFLLFCTLTFTALIGQNPWQKVLETDMLSVNQGERQHIPLQYDTYELDMAQLKTTLKKAPLVEYSDDVKGALLALPLDDGTVEVFKFVESPAMSPVLSSKYPEIKSFKGRSIDNPQNTAWIDYDKTEFRALIHKGQNRVFIDPYFQNADEHYVVYNAKNEDIDPEALTKSCGTDAYLQSLTSAPLPEGKVLPRLGEQRSQGQLVEKVTYRFAVTSTGWWTEQQSPEKDKAVVLGLINTATNRLNSLFEPELAMKLELVDNNDDLIFFKSNTPFTDEFRGRQCLGENTAIINQRIGINAYDMGHCFTVSCTDGIAGVANLGSVCNDRKGNGVSCVGNNNLGNFMIFTTAHELGHQFTAGHTWGNCPPSEDQFSGAHNCEPGSGSTIMSYFGLCGSENNLSGQEVSYYHTCSFEPITNFMENGDASTCGRRDNPGNSMPDVWINDPQGVTIPISTPFELSGDAMDMDAGDMLTYVWEQADNDGIPWPLGSPGGNAPAFRSYPPSDRKSRTFPRLSNILSGTDWKEERLPTYSRDLSFSFVVRDNNLEAGGVNWAIIEMKADDAAGPFLVTSPSALTTIGVNEELVVEWDVANTDGPEVDCQNVDIYFSADNANTFPYLLAAGVPNNGSATVRMPNALTQTGKIKVKGKNNIFFNINRNSIRVVEPTVPSFYVDAAESSFDFCLPEAIEVELLGTSFLGYSEEVTLDVVSGLPATATHSFSQNPMAPGGSSTLSIDMNNVLESGDYSVVVRAVGANADTVYQNIFIKARGSYMGDLALVSPADDTRGLATIPEFSWAETSNASSYRIEIANSPDFASDNLVFSQEMGLQTSIPSPQFNLENSTLYYWRIVAENECTGAVTTPMNIFSSQALSCRLFVSDDLPLNIPSSGTSSEEAVVNIAEQGNVSDVNVNIVKGNHVSLQDVRASIVSPAGTSVILWQGCNQGSVIDAGFDDGASVPNGCPEKNGLKIKPLQELSAFIGQGLEGNWALRIEDVVSGNGGTITDFELELCSSSSLFSPTIIFNETLEVAPSKGAIINNTSLLCRDDNNTAAELRYTLTQLPTKGELVRNGVDIKLGGTFTQADIDGGIMVYKHNGSMEEEDFFTFVVEDGEGGWINQTNYNITMVDGGASTGVNDIESADAYFSIFPNPAVDNISIEKLDQDASTWNVSLHTIDGKLLKSMRFSQAIKVGVEDMNPGIYLLKLDNGNMKLNKKLTIVR